MKHQSKFLLFPKQTKRKLGKLKTDERLSCSLSAYEDFLYRPANCETGRLKGVNMKTKFDYIGHHQQAYNAVLSQIPTGKGHRNAELVPKAAWHAVKLGMDEADFADQILDASAGSDPISQSEIYRAFKTASEKIHHTPVNSTRRIYAATQRMTSPDYVPHLILAGGHSAHAGALRAILPVDVESSAPRPTRRRWPF